MPFRRYLVLSLLFFLQGARQIFAQQTPNEIAVSFAASGQIPLVAEPNNTRFFTKPFIGRIQAQLTSNGIQSLSGFVETVTETRGRQGTWVWAPSTPFAASINENLQMTSLGLETIRTLVSESGFRFGVGIAVGYGFGGASVDVTNLATNSAQHADSFNSWSGLFVSGFVRARYTVYREGPLDVGITLTGRYWGYPAISPLSSQSDSYNGPDLRSLHEVGYLAGVSVGF